MAEAPHAVTIGVRYCGLARSLLQAFRSSCGDIIIIDVYVNMVRAESTRTELQMMRLPQATFSLDGPTVAPRSIGPIGRDCDHPFLLWPLTRACSYIWIGSWGHDIDKVLGFERAAIGVIIACQGSVLQT